MSVRTELPRIRVKTVSVQACKDGAIEKLLQDWFCVRFLCSGGAYGSDGYLLWVWLYDLVLCVVAAGQHWLTQVPCFDSLVQISRKPYTKTAISS